MRKLLLLLLIPLLLGFSREIDTEVVSVTTTATKCPSTPLVGRKYIMIENVGSVIVYIGDSTVTADTASTGGSQLEPGDVWREPFDHTVDIYGRVATGTCNIVCEEGK